MSLEINYATFTGLVPKRLSRAIIVVIKKKKKKCYSKIGQNHSSEEPELLTHMGDLKTVTYNSIKVCLL